jgi:hypothetical protein
VRSRGSAQKISFFWIRSARTSGPASGPAAAAFPAGAASNRIERGDDGPANTTVLLIDQKNTPQVVQAFAIQRIVKFVEMRCKGDRIDIYTFGKDCKLQAVQKLTEDGENAGAGGKKPQGTGPELPESRYVGIDAKCSRRLSSLPIRPRRAPFEW